MVREAVAAQVAHDGEAQEERVQAVGGGRR